MSTQPDSADGKHIVIENGQRVSTPLTEQAARELAARRNRLHEAGSAPGAAGKGKAEVKVNLYG